jgi:hypothetical protein
MPQAPELSPQHKLAVPHDGLTEPQASSAMLQLAAIKLQIGGKEPQSASDLRPNFLPVPHSGSPL